MKRILPLALVFFLIAQLVPLAYAWEIERPGDTIRIDEKTCNSSTDGKAAVGLGASIRHYLHGEYQGMDCATLNLSMTANSRKGMNYEIDQISPWWIDLLYEGGLWWSNEMTNVGDDVIIPFDIPQPSEIGGFSIRFYGGRYSGEYQRVYISSNGFVGFDNYTQASPTPSNIPSSVKPNAFVATVWSDLKVDSSASIETGFWPEYSRWYFVIIWKNVLHKATPGVRLTFAIVFQNAIGLYPEIGYYYTQSQIWVNYKNVSNINTSFTFGIEDQEGGKGIGGLSSGSSLGSSNGITWHFYQYSNNYFLKRVTISFSDTNEDTCFNIRDDNSFVRGMNIQRNYELESGPDASLKWLNVLLQIGVLLMGKAGLVLNVVFIGLDVVDILAYNQLSGRKVNITDVDDEVYQTANITALTYNYAVDATLSIAVDWVLNTTCNTGSHSVTVNAKLEYYEVSEADGTITDRPPISTSLNLKIGPDDNGYLSTADPIQMGTINSRLYIGYYDGVDYYKVNVPQGSAFYVKADVDNHYSSVPDFEISVYAPNGTSMGFSPHGYHHYLQFDADVGGEWRIKASKYENHGYYSLIAGFIVGGGGCPTLFVWNGSTFVDEGVLNIHSEPNVDIVVNHTLKDTPANQNFTYMLKLAEIAYGYNYSHSFIDQVKLYAIDNNGKAHQCWLLYANHSRLGNVWQQLFFSDDDRTETYKDEEITLKFLKPFRIQNPKTFIFQIEGHNPEKE